jgi:hypothetical protein
MALTRQQLTPLDGYDHRIDWGGVLERTNSRLIRWVLGTGFLSFHLAVFTTVLLATLLWNLITRPEDLHLMGPFRVWGVAALAHTLLVGGGLIGWRLFRMGETEAPRPVPMLPRRTPSTPRPMVPRTSGLSQAWTRRMGSAARVNASARRWAATATQRSADSAPSRTESGWPAQPGVNQSTATGAMAQPDVGEATWPDSPPISTTLLGATEHRVSADQVVSVDHRPSQQTADDDPGRTWVDNFVESRTKDKENRWSWVEAAAASWLNRRELSGKAEKALPASSEPEGAAAPPPGDQNRDETPAPQ